MNGYEWKPGDVVRLDVGGEQAVYGLMDRLDLGNPWAWLTGFNLTDADGDVYASTELVEAYLPVLIASGGKPADDLVVPGGYERALARAIFAETALKDLRAAVSDVLNEFAGYSGEAEQFLDRLAKVSAAGSTLTETPWPEPPAGPDQGEADPSGA